ncbi:MAG: type VI secretion system Vgr family protein, partial [Desulfobacterales bacterium]
MEAAEIDYFGDMRQFDFSINGEPLDVYEVNARESIFSCFELEVTVPVGSMRKLEDYIGKEALFTMIGRRKDRFFHGLVSEFTWQEEKGRYYMYKAKVVPLFWKLNLISDVRIFQNKTTKEIVEQVLKESGILSTKYEFRVRGKCCSREYCVQYRETNMEFISRILAEEGMFYYFEFTESGHLLVFGDHPGCHKNIAGDKEVVFSPPGQLRNQIEHVTAFDYSTRVTPGKVALNDYRFDKPSYAAYAEKKGKLYRDLELYDYPGFIKDDTTGNYFADVAFDRAVWDQNTGYGKSVCRSFSPGHTFTLADHFVKELNRQYILTEVIHEGKQPQALQELADPKDKNTYGNSFKCIPSNIAYKPPKPVKSSVQGVQTAFVTGPQGEEIHVDEYGRIKVQFHWDREGENNERSSCWLRVAQPWAGSGWGSMFIPRIGQEVVVSFIDGDPDRPVVTGTLYNGRTRLPYPLPAEKTKSTIKTRSTKGGGGFNEIRFEDKKDAEEIYIHGQKDANIEIINDKAQHIGHDETLDVDNDRTKKVANDQKESIGNNKDIEVEKNHTESIGENSRISIGKNFEQNVGENSTIDIGKNRKETIREDASVIISKNSSWSAGEDSTVSVG